MKKNGLAVKDEIHSRDSIADYLFILSVITDIDGLDLLGDLLENKRFEANTILDNEPVTIYVNEV